jgi:predicted TIM-barrel fold metal-dependent hydrolase
MPATPINNMHSHWGTRRGYPFQTLEELAQQERAAGRRSVVRAALPAVRGSACARPHDGRHDGPRRRTTGRRCVRLEASHPRHLEVAASHPELIIVASRPAWPWQTEMIAILLHKSSVWYELHGWSPRYFAPDLKLEIGRRLQDRVMFGADYPLLGYERLLADWKSEGYAEDVLERVLRGNAEAFLATLRR